jgi:hypothetical protein
VGQGLLLEEGPDALAELLVLVFEESSFHGVMVGPASASVGRRQAYPSTSAIKFARFGVPHPVA